MALAAGADPATVNRILPEPCYCLSLLEEHFAGADGCGFNADWTERVLCGGCGVNLATAPDHDTTHLSPSPRVLALGQPTGRAFESRTAIEVRSSLLWNPDRLNEKA